MMDTITKLEAMKAKSFEPKASAQEEWSALLDNMISKTLFPLANSWWSGGNIPGKKAQTFNYVGGIDSYDKICKEAIVDWQGFEITLDEQGQPGVAQDGDITEAMKAVKVAA